MSLARLVFHPQNSSDRPTDAGTIIDALTEIGLISSTWRENTFLPGPDFLNLLTFLGCSPHIQLHPDDGEQFCYIRLNSQWRHATCLGYTATIKPGCPHCKTRISDWQKISHWQQANSLYECTHCGSRTRMDKLKWRQQCGYGLFSLEIAHIHPHEAVPADKLLTTLEKTSGFRWNYFYASD